MSFNERKSGLKSAEIWYLATNFPKQNSTPKCRNSLFLETYNEKLKKQVSNTELNESRENDEAEAKAMRKEFVQL